MIEIGSWWRVTEYFPIMIGAPNKSVPGGCLIGLFGLLAWGYAGLCAYGILGWYQGALEEGGGNVPWELIGHAVLALLIGVGLLRWGWKLAMRVGDYDAWDPDEPRMKF